MKFYEKDSNLKDKASVIFQLRPAAFNSELSKIYSECKPCFMSIYKNMYANVDVSDIEAAYDDSILALYENVNNGALKELTCSIQTYINRIGAHKIVDICRKKHISTVSYSDTSSEWGAKALEIWDNMDSDDDKERKSIALRIVDKMSEPCRTILSYFYYMEYSMKLIAEKMGLKDSDSAKTTKNRCMSKLRDTTNKQLRDSGLM